MLSLVAASVLEAPSSIAGSERFFSRLTHIISPHRSSLQKDFAGEIVLHSMRHRKALMASARKHLPIPVFGKFDTSTLHLEDLEADDEDNDDDDFIENQEDIAEEIDQVEAPIDAADNDDASDEDTDDGEPPYVASTTSSSFSSSVSASAFSSSAPRQSGRVPKKRKGTDV